MRADETRDAPDTPAFPVSYRSETLDHPGLVAGMSDELGVGDLIDKLIPQDHEKRTVSVGQAVKAMVLNGLGFANRALYLTTKFFRNKPIDRLIDEGIEAEHLNDDALGRALDTLYEHNLNVLYPQIALQAVSRPGLSCRSGQLDATGFHMDGEYVEDGTEEDGVIKLVKGYSRDHRPDLNQLVLQLICEGQAGIPLLMEPLSGNSNDREGFRKTINKHIEQLQGGCGMKYLIADSALYTADTLKMLSNIFWVSRVPETLSREIIDTVGPQLMRDPEQEAFVSLGTEYADVRQCRVVVYSPEAYQREQKSLEREHERAEGF